MESEKNKCRSLRTLQVQSKLLIEIRLKKTRYFGHMKRYNNLVKTKLNGKVSSKLHCPIFTTV